MKSSFLVGLVAGILGLAPLAASAVETVEINGVTATRVVIAPPRTELAIAIKTGLSQSYRTAAKDSATQDDARDLYYFYGARHFEPIWLTTNATGAVEFSAAALSIIQVFMDAEAQGFRVSDYLTPDLDIAAAQGDPARMIALETAFSAATMRYANNAVGGRIRPRDVASTWIVTPRRVNASELLPQLAASADPGSILLGLHPKHPEFLRLRAALAKFSDGTAQQLVAIPEGQTLRAGMTDSRVLLLRERLGIAVPTVEPTMYDGELVTAVTAFQASLGLDADGIIGPATLAALNGGAAATKEDIIANMERWRWLPEDLGTFHVEVNLPEFRLWIVDQGQQAYTTRVVIGTPKNQTPSFSDEIEYIVVNPYWNVPPSIARGEIGPILASNPGYLASQNMELLYGGKVVNASAIDWSTTSISNFRIRQKPGAGNALGQIKFLFPNEHDVYLHDTPSKSLFSRSVRAFSHGCVRVQDPMAFADALLAHTPDLNRASLEGMFGPSEKWITLQTHIPVHLTYFTLRVDPDGTIRSYGDVYGYNKKMVEMLGLAPGA